MRVTMDPAGTIFAAIESILALIDSESSIMTTVEVRVHSKKKPLRSKRRKIHFLFHKPRTYTQVYWTETGFTPRSAKKWTRSANNDGIQVVGHQGIGPPISSVAEALLKEFHENADRQKYEATASWLLGKPEVVKVGITEYPNDTGTYKIEII